MLLVFEIDDFEPLPHTLNLLIELTHALPEVVNPAPISLVLFFQHIVLFFEFLHLLLQLPLRLLVHSFIHLEHVFEHLRLLPPLLPVLSLQTVTNHGLIVVYFELGILLLEHCHLLLQFQGYFRVDVVLF